MADNRDLVIDAGAAGRGNAIAISSSRGALVFEKFGEMVDFSMYMAKSDKAVPSFLRGNPGACMAITIQASEWGFSPFAVARMAYVVNDQIAYMSQLIHAVIERRAPLKQRLRAEYLGEGVERQCKIIGHFKTEVDPLEYLSPKIRDIKVKNSTLWTGDPDQQLFYFASRAWARRYCPDIILGVYAEDELPGAATQHLGAENAKDVSPVVETEGLVHRLSIRAAAAAGFDAKAVAETINEVSGRAPKAAAPKEMPAASVAPVVGQAAVETEPGSPAEGSGLAAADKSPEGGTAPDATQARSEPPAAEESHSASVAGPSNVGSLAEPRIETEESVGPETDGGAPATGAPEPAEASDDGASAGVPDPAEVEGAVAASAGEAAAYKPPPIPANEREYVQYVRATLADPELVEESEVRKWFNSDYEKRLRRSFPNMTTEILDECKALAGERIKQLKGE